MSDSGKTLTTLAALGARGLVPAQEHGALADVAARYAIALTPALADLIDPHDPADPIARQFVPDVRELTTAPGEHADPTGDGPHSPLPGLVHRHPDRVLLKLVHVCPVYCRFCFRRAVVGPDGAGTLPAEALEAALGYIAADPGIWEVILTGGDPLMLSARRIREVVARLAAISHVQIIRWHTRVPVAAPERITPEVVAALAAADKTTYVVLHTNHARELSPAVAAACNRLIAAGIPMVSQSVLLKGVNDTVAALSALFRRLVALRIKPYYLHHADLAPGTAHLRTTLAEGQELVRRLQQTLSGLALPTYVLDIPGGYGKVPVGAAHVHAIAGDPTRLEIEDATGRRHAYPPED